jgi:peptidoglycan/LPS O-acetylase OafA/YrhL
MQYRPEVDGLRALAVIVVILFHADQGCGGGFVGVDVFFVISGYLITSLILKDPEFSYRRFWLRRVRRIIPALACVVALTLVAGAVLLLPSDLVELSYSVLAQCSLAANVFFWNNTGYFEGPAETKPLLHTWSLAVEEQFYLLYPLILGGALRQIMLPLFVFSLASSAWLTFVHPAAAFYLLPTRAWELLLGGLLARSRGAQHPTWLREGVAWCGLLAILGAVLLYSQHTPFPGFAALLPCLGAAALIWANTSTLTTAGRLLATRPLVGIGLLSYSWYLWHWPLFVFVRYWSPGPVPSKIRWLLVLASLALAALSWKCVETPFRHTSRSLRPLGLMWIALVLGALLMLSSNGLPQRFPAQILRFADTKNNEPDWIPQVGVAGARAGQFPPLGASGPGLPIHFLLWGDSHALAMAPAFDELGREFGKRGVAATHSGTLPLLGYLSHGAFALKADSAPFNAAVLDFVRKEQIPNVILVARWTNYPAEGLAEALGSTLEALDGVGCTTWLLLQVPEHQVLVPKALARASLLGSDLGQVGCTLEDHVRRSAPFRALAEQQRRQRTVLLDSTALFFPGGEKRARVSANASALYWDDNHLTVHGGRFLRPLLTPIFRR